MTTYAEGQPVRGHKVIREWPSTVRRWCKAKILYLTQTAEEGGEAYMIEFADGSRGSFDLNHLKK